MDEIVRQVKIALGGMWERRWVGLMVAWACGLAAALGVYKFPDRYEATARVHIDSQSILRPLLQGLTVQQDPSQQAAMLAKTLISRPNIENLLKEIEAGREKSGAADNSQLVDSLIARIKLVSAGRDNLFSVAFRDPDPGHALRVVEGLVTTFLSASQGNKRKDADAAQRFINEQIAVYEKKLEEAENRLKEFKLKHMGLLGNEGKDYFARIAEASKNAERVRIELRAAMQSRDALKRGLAGEDPMFMVDNSLDISIPIAANLTSEVDGRLDAAKKQLDELLRKYTDLHPDVRSTRQLVEHLTAQRQKEIDQRTREMEAKKRAAPKTGKQNPLSANPVVAQIKIALSEAEANIASLRSMAEEHEAKEKQLRQQAKQYPQIEAEFSQLNRDYEIQKKNYESLVGRREQATISADLGAVGGLASFRVVDPPRVAPSPVFPNRLHLLPLALIAVIAVGLASSFAAAQLAPTFPDAQALREIIDKPVLGTVSFLSTDAMVGSMRRRHAAFAMAVVMLVCGYGAMFVLLSVSSGVI